MRLNASAGNRSGLLVCVLCTPIVAATQSTAVAQDHFDGALWKFEMTNKKDPSRKLGGRFRVSNHVLYQMEDPSDSKLSKRVGKNYPNGKRTRFEVSDFRAFTPKSLFQKGVGRV